MDLFQVPLLRHLDSKPADETLCMCVCPREFKSRRCRHVFTMACACVFDTEDNQCAVNTKDANDEWSECSLSMFSMPVL
jgi:hypothetical protein